MQKLRNIVGITLIVLSLISMYLWETKYRDRFLFEDVAVLSEDLDEYTALNETMIKIVKYPKENIPDGAVKPEDIKSFYGLNTKLFLKENMIVLSYFFDEYRDAEIRQSFYVPKEWIYVFPETINPNTSIAFYELSTNEYLGTFNVISFESGKYIEIECEEEFYFRMLEYAGDTNHNKYFLSVERS